MNWWRRLLRFLRTEVEQPDGEMLTPATPPLWISATPCGWCGGKVFYCKPSSMPVCAHCGHPADAHR